MGYAFYLDPTLPLSLEDIEKLKPGTVARLRKNGRAHMGRAKRINVAREALNKKLPPDLRRPMLEIEDFDPIEVYAAADWTCPSCFKRVDVTKAGTHPDSCVLGHALNFAHDGGHTRKNCGPWHHSCNAAAAANIETPREAKINRLRASYRGIDKNGGKASKKSKTPIRSKGFSKSGPSKWPKGRKIQSRGFDRG